MEVSSITVITIELPSGKYSIVSFTITPSAEVSAVSAKVEAHTFVPIIPKVIARASIV